MNDDFKKYLLKPDWEKPKRNKPALILIIAAVVLALGYIGSSDNTEIKTNKEKKKYPQAGDSVVLSFGENSTYVGVTKNAISEFVKYAAARDMIGVNELMAAGFVFKVPNGTLAKLIQQTSFSIREIRIMSGLYTDIKGYVVSESVHLLENNSLEQAKELK